MVKKLKETVIRNNQGSSVYARMKANGFATRQVLVEKQVNVPGLVVDEPEGGNRTRRKAQVFFQSFRRGKAQFSLLQALLKVADIQFLAVL